MQQYGMHAFVPANLSEKRIKSACMARPPGHAAWACGIRSEHVNHITHAGVEVENLKVDAGQRAALAHICFEVREASVAAAALHLPTWRAPLVLRLGGVRLELHQRNMPTVKLVVHAEVVPARST